MGDSNYIVSFSFRFSRFIDCCGGICGADIDLFDRIKQIFTGGYVSVCETELLFYCHQGRVGELYTYIVLSILQYTYNINDYCFNKTPT